MDPTALVTAVRRELLDPDGERFDDAMMAEALADGARHIAALRPDAVEERTTIETEEGVLQSIPEDGWRLIDVTSQLDGDGKPLRSVEWIDGAVLDRFDPEWRAADTEDRIEGYVWDERMARRTPGSPVRQFLVTPPAEAGLTLEILYAKDPGSVDEPTDGEWSDLPIPSSYAPQLRQWLLYRAYSIDTSQVATEMAMRQYSLFRQGLGEKTMGEIETNRGMRGGEG